MNLNLPIKIIRRDFDEPELLFNEKVQEIAEAMRRGDTIPPITVCYDGREYRLQDGFHRVAAALSLGRDMIEAEVLPPTLADSQAEFAPMVRDNRGRW